MKTTQPAFLEFLGQSGTRFAIPIFQRVYSWTDRECEDFWDDTMRAGRQSGGHFMGVVLFAEDPEGWHEYRRVNIIDGQQRMTTLSLLLVALSHYLRERGGTVAGLSADDLLDRYLRVGEGDAAEGKLVLTHLDTYTLFSLVAGLDIPEEHAQRILDNYGIFAELMREPGFDPEELWRGLEALRIVAIELSGTDNPQFVFESLNSKGMSLVTGDLVKSQILMADTPRGQSASDQLTPTGKGSLYERYWIPMERSVLELDEDDIDMTRLIHSWMASLYRYEHIYGESEIYGLFKEHQRFEHDGSLERTLIELRGYARRFVQDAEFRAQSLANAHDWLEGKPVRFVSELRLFGD